MGEDEQIAVHAHFAGIVQGVFFMKANVKRSLDHAFGADRPTAPAEKWLWQRINRLAIHSNCRHRLLRP